MSETTHSPERRAGHNMEEIYQRLGALEQSVAGIQPMLQALHDDFQAVKQRQNQPVNWLGIATLVLGILSLSAGFTTLNQQGLKATQGSIVAQLNELTRTMNNRAEIVHSGPVRLSYLEESRNRHEDYILTLSERLAGVEAHVEGLQEHNREYEQKFLGSGD